MPEEIMIPGNLTGVSRARGCLPGHRAWEMALPEAVFSPHTSTPNSNWAYFGRVDNPLADHIQSVPLPCTTRLISTNADRTTTTCSRITRQTRNSSARYAHQSPDVGYHELEHAKAFVYRSL
jgi:hypothetical protein